MLPGEVLYVCTARAAINESVCEDSHAEFAIVIIVYKTKMGIVHMQCLLRIDGSHNGWCLLNILL